MDGTSLIEVDCPYCSGSHRRPMLKKGGFQLVFCKACGLVYQSPRMSDTLRRKSWEGSRRLANGLTFLEHYQSGEKWREEIASRRLDFLAGKGFRGGRLLDLGCATGIFLRAARERGFETQGVDVSAVLAEFGRNHYGLDIRSGDFLDLPMQGGSFDVVTAFDVFSSMSRPLEMLEKVRFLLKPRGLLWLTASCANLGLWVFKESNPFNTYVTPRTMTAFLKKAGFESVSVKTIVKNANTAKPYEVMGVLYRIPVINTVFKKMVDAVARN